jgi:hypothetical protein
MEKAKRVGGIDFWRGAVLIAILIDHIPGNLLENVTPRNFGLSDSAEAFVFLSGLSVGMVYLPRAHTRGWTEVARACIHRALKIYGVHIGLTLAALVIFACAYWMSGLEDLVEAHGRSFVFSTPATGLAGLALMTLQLGYFNILPLYVVLMLWAPVALAIAMRRPGLALIVSLGLYAASRLAGLHLPNWPEPGSWFFNPFAWQLVFTFGLISAILWRDRAPRPIPGLTTMCVVIVALSAIVITGGLGLVPGLRDAAVGRLDVAKQDLGVARLVHFAALAYLVAICPGLSRVTGGAGGRAVQALGRNSLLVFATGSLISALGQVILEAAALHLPNGVERMAGFAYTIGGITVLFALVRWIECRSPPVLSARPRYPSPIPLG